MCLTQPAAWSAVRDAAHSYGFAAFTLEPGSQQGLTSITVTYHDVLGPYGQLEPLRRSSCNDLGRPRRR